MGSLFSKPRNKSYSQLDPTQQGLLQPLADFFLGEVNNDQPEIRNLISKLMSSTTDESRAMSERIFTEGIMAPALRTFDEQIQPRIASNFARYGATMGSRRGQAVADALTTVQTDAQGQIARMLPEIYNFPLQQTLAQIQGYGALQSQRLAPRQAAMQFALQPTRTIQQTAAGPGWGLLNSAIGAAGFALGGGLGGLGSLAGAAAPAGLNTISPVSDYLGSQGGAGMVDFGGVPIRV